MGASGPLCVWCAGPVFLSPISKRVMPVSPSVVKTAGRDPPASAGEEQTDYEKARWKNVPGLDPNASVSNNGDEDVIVIDGVKA